MAAVTFTEEFTTTISAPRMFKALIVDGDNLIPKLVPQAFKSVETVEGNGGVGSIKQINFAEGNPLKYVKHRVEALDKESMSYSYSLVEVGDGLLDKFITISYDVKFEPTSDGGCIARNVSKYLPKAGVEINEEEIKGAAKEKAKGISKAVEAYLLANPHAYA